MDYKLNKLSNEVVCDTILYNDFPQLMFGKLKNDRMVFDATAYAAATQMEDVSYQVFSRINKRYIEAILKMEQAERGLLFFENTDGHILMDISLSYLYLGFINPDIYIYFNVIIGDAIENGMAFSDGFAVTLAMERLPINILNEIIKVKQANTETK